MRRWGREIWFRRLMEAFSERRTGDKWSSHRRRSAGRTETQGEHAVGGECAAALQTGRVCCSRRSVVAAVVQKVGHSPSLSRSRFNRVHPYLCQAALPTLTLSSPSPAIEYGSQLPHPHSSGTLTRPVRPSAGLAAKFSRSRTSPREPARSTEAEIRRIFACFAHTGAPGRFRIVALLHVRAPLSHFHGVSFERRDDRHCSGRSRRRATARASSAVVERGVANDRRGGRDAAALAAVGLFGALGTGLWDGAGVGAGGGGGRQGAGGHHGDRGGAGGTAFAGRVSSGRGHSGAYATDTFVDVAAALGIRVAHGGPAWPVDERLAAERAGGRDGAGGSRFHGRAAAVWRVWRPCSYPSRSQQPHCHAGV
eukprot:ctg_1953.g720